MICREGSPGRVVYFPCLAAATYGQYAIQDHQQWLADAVRIGRPVDWEGFERLRLDEDPRMARLSGVSARG
jgi:hypothetical protein